MCAHNGTAAERQQETPRRAAVPRALTIDAVHVSPEGSSAETPRPADAFTVKRTHLPRAVHLSLNAMRV